MEQRPDPKELLKYVQKEEQQQRQGKLKIYLGAAPGVGKTYSMLKDALEKSQDGLDVVAGIVETHDRLETKALLKNLETLPRHTLHYRGKVLQEFDLDGALARQPKLVLVDEMAHTNAPGSRHNKRWQDILELLDRGIDVYTTLNVQHIESLNNIVTQITGVVVRETVPDTLLEKAHAIELIDLPPEDLIKRLKEGKVYISTDAGLAIEHFFREGNLIALRELALRVTAEQVNTEVLLHRHGTSIEKIWPTTERLLVCIAPNPHAPELIRSTYRMAKRLRAEWIAIYVETPHSPLSEEERHNIVQYLQLAERLKGQTLTIGGTDVLKEIINFARNHKITKVILGKKARSRWQDFFKRSLADELVRHSDDIDLYILRDNLQKAQYPKKNTQPCSTPKIAYLTSIATVSVCTAINFLIFKYAELSTLMMVYFLGIIFVSTQGFFGPSFLTSLLSVFMLGSLFMPHHKIGMFFSDTPHLIMLASMLFVSQVVSHITLLIKQQANFSRIREQRTATMHLLSKQLAHTRGIKPLLEIAVLQISDVFNSQVLALLPDKNHKLIPITGKNTEFILTPKDQSVAQWVYELGQTAGLGTQTLPDNEAIYIPLLGSKGSLGVLRVLPKDPNRFLIPEQLRLLEGFCNQTAMALDVDRLEGEANSAKIQMETDKVRNVLLKSISDNMHSPLIDIMNSANQVIEKGYQLNSLEIQEIGNSIYDYSKDLNHLINKVSQISRLETTETTPIKKLHSINTLNKVINIAIKSLGIKNRIINIQLPTDLPQIYFNKVFIEQVFFNIIENASKYTPFDTPIDISAALEKDRVVISIEDHGPGLALEEINKIFEKFYRGQAITNIQGMGLGLAICQKIINLHGGEIWAENRLGGGAIFRFTLPLQESS